MSGGVRKHLYGSSVGAIELMVGRRLERVRLLRGAGRGEAAGAGPGASRFVRALDRYFAGGGVGMPARELDLSGCTEFQREIYLALMEVSRGKLVSYGELACAVGRPGGARAAGQALARNPVPIFVPCHRVVAADGAPGGFSAGLDWKKRLLQLEGYRLKDGRFRAVSDSEPASGERTAERDRC